MLIMARICVNNDVNPRCIDPVKARGKNLASGPSFQEELIQFSRIMTCGEATSFPVNGAFNAHMFCSVINTTHPDC